MINRRLLGLIPDSKKYIIGNVMVQWIGLLANIIIMTMIAQILSLVIQESMNTKMLFRDVVVVLIAIYTRYTCTRVSAKLGYLSSKKVKQILREKIYRKLLCLGLDYCEKTNTSEIVQVAVDGVEQLDTYFGAYIPQFFYAMLAPMTLFFYICFYNVLVAVMLLICVPLIPIAIAFVQKWAKKLLAKYWGQYTKLGGTFLENLQGLTTLKIYQADEFKNKEMNDEAEKFRKITMKVLSMQLNSITIMDLIAYGGAALGVILAITQYRLNHVSLNGCLLIMLLSADFFIPMRQLGSFFHVAMNGMAASEKIFNLLDLPEKVLAQEMFPQNGDMVIRDLHFSYDAKREILKGVDLTFPRGQLTSIVGESGCGKSTIASILMGKNQSYSGKFLVGNCEAKKISDRSRMKNITYISHQSHIFKGDVRNNLLLADPNADDAKLWKVLDHVKLGAFLRSEKGLETQIFEGGSNFSGGQRQRLALARAILHDSPIYIFDEATSNIDVESETDIMEMILELAKTKTVILISHRLANVVKSDCIYVLEKGRVAESGTHEELLVKHGKYECLWNVQQRLENYGKEAAFS